MSPVNPQKISIIIQNPNAEKNFQQIDVVGEIDRDSMQSFHDQMEGFLGTFNGTNIVFNLEKLEFINSEGIGYLSDVHNRFEVQNKHVFIINTSSRIIDIFQLVGLNQIIPCYSGLDELLKNLKS